MTNFEVSDEGRVGIVLDIGPEWVGLEMSKVARAS